MLKYYISIEVSCIKQTSLKGKNGVEDNLFTELKLSYSDI